MKSRTASLTVLGATAVLLLACNPTPATPKNLVAAPGDARVDLSWAKVSHDDLKGYDLYWGTSESALDQTKLVDKAATTAAVTGLVNGVKYYFAIDAVDTGGTKSDRTAIVSATPRSSDTTAPTISEVVPEDGAINFPVGSAITLRFSESIAIGSFAVTSIPAVTFGTPEWSENNSVVKLTPSIALGYSTVYALTVAANDLAGNALAGNVHVSFTTAPPPDTTAPTIVSTMPGNGSINVAINQALSITFSEPIDPSTLQVTIAPDPEPGDVSWDTELKMATFAGHEAFAYDTVYVVTVEAKDAASNALAPHTTFGFRTANPPDLTPPEVVSTSPADGAVVVPVTTNLSITFSEAMDQASVEAAFALVPAHTGTFLWDGSKTLMTFMPSSPLAWSTNYQVTLGVGASDLAGNHIAAPKVFAFGTATQPDVINPTFVGSKPANGLTGVARNTNIEISFSEPMDKASTQIAFAVTQPAGTAGLFTWNSQGTMMTFNPNVDFAHGTDVTWTVSTAAKDLAGNTLAQAVSRTFRVIRLGSATINATPSLTGYLGSNGTVAVNSSYLVAGDGYSNSFYRGFISFSLAGLPSTTTRISSATLSAYQSSVNGDPYTRLGALWAQGVRYGSSLETGDFEVQSNYDTTLSTSATSGWHSAIVTGPVQLDWSSRSTLGSRTQFRLKHTLNAYLNASPDDDFWDSGSGTNPPKLIVQYEYP